MDNKVIINRRNEKMNLFVWKSLQPQAVFIIAHGASEHIKRYNDLALFLKNNSIDIYGYNHLGHGDNKKGNVDGVFFGKKDGDQKIVDDLEDVCLHVYQLYPNLPIIVFGHSMGSLIVRKFTIKTKLLVDKVILCGSLHPKEKTVNLGLGFAKVLTSISGKTRVLKVLNKFVFKKLEDTLSYNESNVEKYKKDKNCGTLFTNQAILDLLKLNYEIVKEDNIKKMLKTKYFIISGKEDPFSDNTVQLDDFINLLSKYEFDYQYKFYDNMKHEILNEDDNINVYKDILNFIQMD